MKQGGTEIHSSYFKTWRYFFDSSGTFGRTGKAGELRLNFLALLSGRSS